MHTHKNTPISVCRLGLMDLLSVENHTSLKDQTKGVWGCSYHNTYREDTVTVPQCIALNEMFGTGCHMDEDEYNIAN